VYPRHLHKHSYLSLSNCNFMFKLSKTEVAPKFVSIILQLSKTVAPLLAPISLHFRSQILLPVYQNDSITRNSNSEKPHRPNLIFWKAKPCANLTKQTPNLRWRNIFGCYPLALPTQWIMPSTVPKSRVSLRNTELQNSHQLDSWCSSQTHDLDALTALILFRCFP